MAENENPFITGSSTFYQGEYATAEPAFNFRDPVLDQRPAVMVEIEASNEMHVWTLHLRQGVHNDGNLWYYWVNNAGLVARQQTDPSNTIAGKVVWFHNNAFHPAYYIFVDETDNFRYLSHNNDTGTFVVTAAPPPDTVPRQGEYVGRYLEVLSQDGETIYWIRTWSGNTWSVTANRVEPWRKSTIYLSQGLPGAIRDGNLYKELIRDVADIELRIPEIETGFGGACVPRAGEMTIEVGDAELDWLCSQKWDSREVVIRSGSTTEDPVLWPIVYRAQTETANYDENLLSIRLRDYGTYFDRELQPNKYLGTGGYQGTVDMQGRLKPLCFGLCRGVPATLVDPTYNIYQAHDGPVDIGGLTAIAVAGGLRPILGDIFDAQFNFGNLYNWQPTTAQAAGVLTHRSGGLFRFATKPEGVVTVSVMSTRRTNGERTVASFVRAVHTSKLSDIPLDIASFDTHSQRVVTRVNRYVDREMTIREFFDDLLSTTGGVVGINRLGRLFIRQIERGVPRQHLTELDVVEDSLKIYSPPKPAKVYKVGGHRYYRVLSESEWVPAIPDASRVLFSNEYRYREYAFTSPYLRYDSAGTFTINSPFDFVEEAESWARFIAERQQACKRLIRIELAEYLFKFELGDTVLFDYPRFDLHTPHVYIIVGIRESMNDSRTELYLWGP